MDTFEILADQYRPMLLTYLKTLSGDQHLAEDLSQEVFLTACARLSEFRQGASFGAWLRGIARNKLLQNRRVSARHRLIADSRIIEGMEDVYAVLDKPRLEAETWDERIETLRTCLSRLTGTLRQTVQAVYEKGLSLRDAATTLNASFEATAQRVARARVLLRECMSSGQAERRVS